MAKKQSKPQPKPASVAQRNKLFADPFEQYEAEPEVVMLQQHEVATCNALYNQGQACIDKGIEKTLSIGFKSTVDRKANPVSNGKKSERVQAKSFIDSRLSKWKPATVRIIRDACNAILGE